MPVNKSQAKKLLNATEFALFEATTATALKELSATQVGAKIRRVRTLRDKARDLFQRQRLAARARTGNKGGTSGVANARTEQKVQVFEEILTRLEARAAKLEAQAAKAEAAAARSAAKASASAAKPAKKLTSTRRKAANKTDRAAARVQTQTDKRTAVAERKPAAKKAATVKKAAVAKKAVAKTAVAKKAAIKKVTVKKATAKKAPAVKKAAAKKSATATSPKKKAASKRAAAETVTGGKHLGFADSRAQTTARQRGFEEGRTKAIQAHVSSRGRRSQAKRDGRG